MLTPNHKDLARMVEEATYKVFTTMLGLEISADNAYVGNTAAMASNGVVSFIGLAGPWAGTGSISCSAQCACRISAQLMMSECQAVDEDVLDVVAEMTNMIIGNVKTRLEESLGPMGLSIPTVIYGRNFSSRTIGKQEWTIVPFLCGEDRLEVQLCLAPRKPEFPQRASQ